ncbi:Rid family hydrolase [Halomonas campaniensis]|uniref:RidA family protein n=1 Tax=Halomonas campaniensis TaxID=213554 RepID=UPI000B52960F
METCEAPTANGRYSQTIESEGVIYLSMELPIDPKTGALAETLADQARQLFHNCSNILKAAQSSLTCLLSAAIYLTDMNDWNRVNGLFANAFGNHKPARGMGCVPALRFGAKISIQMIAERKCQRSNRNCLKL